MAAPIAHIFLATQMLASLFQGLYNEKEFIVGTSFPDIQYLKVIPRTTTHFTNVTLQQILQEKNSFKAGMLFHSFVDEQREAFVVKNNFYDAIPQFRFSTQSLKFAEDQILRSLFDIARYQSYFDNVLDVEKTYGIDQIHIKDWHTFLQNYFNGTYSNQDFLMKYFDLNEPNAWFIKRWLFSWFYASKIESATSIIIENERIKNLILDFYTHFSERFNASMLQTDRSQKTR